MAQSDVTRAVLPWAASWVNRAQFPVVDWSTQGVVVVVVVVVVVDGVMMIGIMGIMGSIGSIGRIGNIGAIGSSGSSGFTIGFARGIVVLMGYWDFSVLLTLHFYWSL